MYPGQSIQTGRLGVDNLHRTAEEVNRDGNSGRTQLQERDGKPP
jgi:hypothetical protein